MNRGMEFLGPVTLWKVALALTVFISMTILLFSCGNISKEGREITKPQTKKAVTAKDILGNPAFQAISFGGYRQNTRDIQPTVEMLEEDMLILHAMGIRVLRTYNTKLAHATNVVKAIDKIKKKNPDFEMYVMLGAWIDCQGAWTPNPNHDIESEADNAAEIERAVKLANEYPDIIKIIAVGNEAMVKWAASYFVQPGVILKWVNHLQGLKKEGKLPADLWITSSDNFASWGGGGGEYHVEDLEKLIKAVDYVSLHTYPMHDTHYNPQFWGNTDDENNLSESEKIDAAMERALGYAKAQYDSTSAFIHNIRPDVPVHIGETGWATYCNGFYGTGGSKAVDEYKSGLYYKLMRDWTTKENISCFYFEAFDEPWKDAQNPGGSENHFGIFDVNGNAKFAIWDLVDKGTFEGLSRGGNPIAKTHEGNKETLLKDIPVPPMKEQLTIAY